MIAYVFFLHAQMKEVQIDGENLCVANIDRKYYAIGNV
jgi:hypothetical protein